MDTIILILVAMGSLSAPDRFNDDYRNTHECEIGYATTIYVNDQYYFEEGGIVISDEVNPCECH